VAWLQIVSHKEPVIQGVAYVMEGNLHRAARPPGGGLFVPEKSNTSITNWYLVIINREKKLA